jgi:Flp pilus assembly protein TadG
MGGRASGTGEETTDRWVDRLIASGPLGSRLNGGQGRKVREREMGHMGRIAGDGGRERGAALIEMALVFPLLILLLIGIWSTARAWNVHNTMDHAVREAARYAATVDPWSGGSAAAVRAIADAELAASAVPTGSVQTLCIEKVADAATGCGGTHSNTTGTDQVVVKLQYPSFPLDFVFFSVTVDLSSSAAARYES